MDPDLDLTQLDLSDPETRAYVQQNIDLNDPETKKWFDSTAQAPVQTPAQPAVPEAKGVDRSLTLGNPFMSGIEKADAFDESIKRQGGWGLSDETRSWLGAPDQRTGGILNTIQNVPADIADVGFRALQGGMGVFEAGAQALNKPFKAFNLDDTLSWDGNKFLPGDAALSLAEAFPLGGLETGMLPKSLAVGEAPKDWLASEVRARIEAAYETGTADEILKVAREAGADIDEGALRNWVDYRNSNNPEVTAPTFKSLEEEAQAFKGSAEPTAEDLFGPAPKTLAENTPDFLKQSLQQAPDEYVNMGPFEPARVEDLWPTEASKAADTAALESRLQKEAMAFRPSELPAAEDLFSRSAIEAAAPVDAQKMEHLNSIKAAYDDVSRDWANAPNVEIVNSIDDIADPALRAELQGKTWVKGLINDGTVRIIADNVQPHEIPAIAFHEALGHNGLSNVFQTDLDSVLTGIYDQSPWFKHEVDKWIKDNKGAYSDGNVVARAADEVLAKMSEGGPKQRGLVRKAYDQMANAVKNMARRAGIKVEYSPREIDSILAMAHDSVINGTIPRDNGFSVGTRFYGEYDKKSLTAEKIETIGDVDDVLDFLGNETQRYRKEPVSIDETKRIATDFGLNESARYLRGRSFSEQKIAAKLQGGKQALTNQVQDLVDLRARAEKEGLTPSLMMDIQEKIASASAVYARFDDDTAEIGRSLRMLREISESRKLGKELSRYMDSDSIEGLISDPAALIRFLDDIADTSKTQGVGAAAKKLKGGGSREVHSLTTEIMNLPRTMMSTADLSAPLRQGVFLVGRPQFWRGLIPMVKQAFSPKYADFIAEEIVNRPSYPLMKNYKLAVDRTHNLSSHEEAFIGNMAEKIPGIGKIVAGSERAYSGFLHKLRADMFDGFLKDMERAGDAPDAKRLRDMAEYINTATGRGNLPKSWETAAPMLSSIFFSPRLMASRLQLLNPQFYLKLDPFVRKQAIRDLLSFGSVAAGAASVAALLGADVQTDPRSSDFAKIKVGNTRYDILGGFGQYLTLGARLATNEKLKPNGDVQTLGRGFGADTKFDVAADFFSNKASPIASYVVQYLKGTKPSGEEFDPAMGVLERMVPIITQDIAEVYAEDGAAGLPKLAPSIFGVGVQNYETAPEAKVSRFGKPIEEDVSEDPVVSEITRLEDATNKDIILRSKDSIKVDGEDLPLSSEQNDQLQEITGELLSQKLSEVFALPGYAGLTDEEKIVIVRDLQKEARKEAKDMFIEGLAEGTL